ncbi:MAG: hypothetical protein E7423_08915 [Ruminococcaceae bacterium]|nr:hypothetical protein [Oscillospiraceae bacterium]
MNDQIGRWIARLLSDKVGRGRWRRLTALLSVLVIAVTAYGLRVPADTMTAPDKTLVCPLSIHEHTGDCYDDDGTLLCGEADYVVHLHNENCYDEEDGLICPLPEIEPHIHDESCWEEEQIAVCGLAEREEHYHDDACYAYERGELICTVEDEDHEHIDECYEWDQRLICTKREGEGHERDESCFETRLVMTCGALEMHDHIGCYDDDGNLTCGRIRLVEHIHGPGCFHIEESAEEPAEDAGEPAAWDIVTSPFGGREAPAQQTLEEPVDPEPVRTPNAVPMLAAAGGSSAESVELLVGETETLAPTDLGTGKKTSDSWKIDDPDVAEIVSGASSSSCTVRALAPGEAVVTLTHGYGKRIRSAIRRT